MNAHCGGYFEAGIFQSGEWACRLSLNPTVGEILAMWWCTKGELSLWDKCVKEKLTLFKGVAIGIIYDGDNI